MELLSVNGAASCSWGGTCLPYPLLYSPPSPPLAHAYLLVVHGEVVDLVQREERLEQEVLVLVLERQRKAVDDRAEDLQELGDAVVPLRLPRPRLQSGGQ